MSRKVKVSDIRQGVTLYEVMAFPHKDGGAWITPITVQSTPRVRNTKSLFADQTEWLDNEPFEPKLCRSIFSLKDRNIIPNSYNFHQVFHTLKAAQRYADRMKRGCLTADERKRVVRLRRDHLDIMYFGF